MRDRVVIVGAGFAGLTAARMLADRPVEVLVVDRHNYHLFQPLLYQVATAGLDPQDIAHSTRGIFQGAPNVSFRMGEVTAVDWPRRQLHVTSNGTRSYVPFDWLILAAGAATETFGVPGADEHTFALKTLDDAVRLRDHVLLQFERADADPTLVDRGALTIVVVGGGPTGVELTGAFAELFDHVLDRDFPAIDVERARIVLVEALADVLPGYAPSSRRYATAALEGRGVQVLRGTPIASVDAGGVELADGRRIRAATVVWAAGIRAVPLADRLDLDQLPDGRILVGPDLSVSQHPEAFVVGDLAAASDDHGELYPQLAPVAIQQSRHAVRQLARRRVGLATKPFRYVDPGVMATIGRQAAVAEFPGRLRLRGTLAWLAWLLLHLMQLVGFRNRASVLVNWLHGYVTYDRAARLIVRAANPDPGGHDAV